jgi:tRNA1(Val) A37 N6-methylase TrmN6
VAKAIYEHFNAEHVLDFSSGWGDRFAGFSAAVCTKSYIGVDPNTRLFEGYMKQVSMYNSGKDVQFINEAAEDVNFSKFADKFDMIFTSCPYYLAERYTNEPNQSWVRYKKLDTWLESFIFTTLRNTYTTLKKGGILALNISDVYLHHTINQICNPTIKYAIENLGYVYIGAYGLKMAKRPNSKAVGKGIFAEPIFLLQK